MRTYTKAEIAEAQERFDRVGNAYLETKRIEDKNSGSGKESSDWIVWCIVWCGMMYIVPMFTIVCTLIHIAVYAPLKLLSLAYTRK